MNKHSETNHDQTILNIFSGPKVNDFYSKARTRVRPTAVLLMGILVFGTALPGSAASNADRCEANTVSLVAKFAKCRLAAQWKEAKGVGDVRDLERCNVALERKERVLRRACDASDATSWEKVEDLQESIETVAQAVAIGAEPGAKVVPVGFCSGAGRRVVDGHCKIVRSAPPAPGAPGDEDDPEAALLGPAAGGEMPILFPRVVSQLPARPGPTGHSLGDIKGEATDTGSDRGKRSTQRGTDFPSGLEGDEASDYGELMNTLLIQTGSHVEAGSAVMGIQFLVGETPYFLAAPEGGFEADQSLIYDLNENDCPACWDDLDPDDWDRLRLKTNSFDGLQVRWVGLVHSNVPVLWDYVDAWLDLHYGFVLDLSLDTSMQRWAALEYTRVTQLYYAAQDLGQTGAFKYDDTGRPWCSEFAAWALRKAGLATPRGSISTASLASFFEGEGRKHDREALDSGTYQLKPGDFLSLFGGNHSGLFVRWSSRSGKTPQPGDTFLSIEGNVSNAVQLVVREWEDSDIQFAGDAQ
jgi:hypothetical protein